MGPGTKRDYSPRFVHRALSSCEFLFWGVRVLAAEQQVPRLRASLADQSSRLLGMTALQERDDMLEMTMFNMHMSKYAYFQHAHV